MKQGVEAGTAVRYKFGKGLATFGIQRGHGRGVRVVFHGESSSE
jgi:hypothetical protein